MAAHNVVDNRAASQFELTVDGETATLVYERRPHAIAFVHTEVPPRLRGQHLGDELAKAGLDAAAAEGLRVIALCPFVKAYMAKHAVK